MGLLFGFPPEKLKSVNIEVDDAAARNPCGMFIFL